MKRYIRSAEVLHSSDLKLFAMLADDKNEYVRKVVAEKMQLVERN